MTRHHVKKSLLARVKAWVISTQVPARAPAVRRIPDPLPLPSSQLISEIFDVPARRTHPPPDQEV